MCTQAFITFSHAVLKIGPVSYDADLKDPLKGKLWVFLTRCSISLMYLKTIKHKIAFLRISAFKLLRQKKMRKIAFVASAIRAVKKMYDWTALICFTGNVSLGL